MNKIIELLRDGTMQRLIIRQGTTTDIPAGGSLAFDLDVGYNRILLKSIEVTANKDIPFYVQFFEEPLRTNSRYHSGEVNREAYDVLDLPYVDKANAGKMYFTINNTSEFTASFTIEARGLELK